MPKTNGIIENKAKLGARVLLRQAGLSSKRWPFAVSAFCAARNLENQGEGTAWGRRNDDRVFRVNKSHSDVLLTSSPSPLNRVGSKRGLQNASERENGHKADENPTKDHWTFDGESGKLVRVHIKPV